MTHQFRGKLETNVSLTTFNTWRTGGAADVVFWPADKDDLADFLAAQPTTMPLTYLGLGSNVLIRDAGVRGTVIMLHGCLAELSMVSEKVIFAGAGVPCAKVAKFAKKHLLTGAEFFAGIPGTVGGALRMNAGAFGGETWEIVEQAFMLTREGKEQQIMPSELQIGYRSVQPISDECFVGANLVLQKQAKDHEDKIRPLLALRAEKQPLGAFSCGSVFTNPPGDHAARLIESCGLKGYRIGGATVANKHANFILNDDNATANDIERLIYHVQNEVEKKHGVKLHTEVKFIGELS